jgi:hypothetical protein
MITTVCKLSYSSRTVPPIVQAVQGDTGRTVRFDVTDFTIPAGAEATYFIEKPSGEAVYNAATISGNSILCELTAQSLAEPGENKMQVRVILDDEIVTSFKVCLLVSTFWGIDAIESGTEMNIFDQAVEQATEQFQENAEQIVEEVIEYIPADYTELTEEVTQLNERFNAYFPEYRNRLYVVGEYVTYNGYLLQCIKGATFPQPAPLNPDYWRVVQIDSLDALNAALYEMVSLIADPYIGMGQSYAVGDYCIYNNRLYRCTDAIESAMVFDSAKWEQVDSITNDYSLTVVDGMLCVAYEE